MLLSSSLVVPTKAIAAPLTEMVIGGYDNLWKGEESTLDFVLEGTMAAVAASLRWATNYSKSSAAENWHSSLAPVEAVHSLGLSIIAKKARGRQSSR